MRNFTKFSAFAVALLLGMSSINAQTYPTIDPPTPDYPEADVVGFFGDKYGSYTTLSSPNWGQTSTYKFVEVGEESSAMLIQNLVWLPVQLQSPGDQKNFEYVHVDVFCNENTSFRIGFHTTYPDNLEVYFPTMEVEAGKWYSVEYPMTLIQDQGFGRSPINLLRFGNEDGVTYSNEIYVANMFMFNGTPKYLYTNGIEGETVDSQFSVYPSVATDVLNIKAENNIEKVSIYNISGQVVATYKVNATSDAINVSDLNAGVYVLSAKLASGAVVPQRFIKK